MNLSLRNAHGLLWGCVLSLLFCGSGCFAPVSESDLAGAWRLTQERWEGGLIPARTFKVYDFHDNLITRQGALLGTAYQLYKHCSGTQLTVQSPRTIELLDPIYDDKPMTFRVAIEETTMTWYMGVMPMEMYIFEREETP